MGVSRSAERADGLCPSTPQAAGAPLEHALFLNSRYSLVRDRLLHRGFYFVLVITMLIISLIDFYSTERSYYD